jgi:hypothetical protein
MGKNQSASNLTNIIKQDANGGIAFMSGSTMLMTLSNTGQMSGSSPAMSAVTASYADNFTVKGTLTAQTIVSQVVTSSTSLVTGSTRFGSTIDNTHQFSGSVSVSGSADIVDQLRIGGSTVISYDVNAETTRLGVGYAPQEYTKAIIIDNSTGHGLMVRQNNGAGKIVEFSGPEGTLGLMISGSGNVGIGTSTFPYNLSGRGYLSINGTSSSLLEFQVGASSSAYLYSSPTNFEVNANGSRWIQFNTNGSERMRITSAGMVGIGTTTVVEGTQAAGSISIFPSSSVSSAPLIQFPGNGRIRPASNGDRLSIDGNSLFLNGTFSGNIVMATGGGNVGIGTSTPTSSLHIYSAATSGSQAQLVISNPTSNTNDAAGIRFNANAGGSQWDVKFQTVRGIDWFQMTNDAGTSVQHSWNGTRYYPGASSLGTTRAGYITGNGTQVGVGVSPDRALFQVGDVGITAQNTYFGTGQVRVGGGSDHGSNTVFSVAPGVVTFDRPGVGGGAFTINSSGHILTPSQPAFYAYLPGGATTTTTGNFAGFNTTRLNRGSHYNTSNGRFTAPTAGVYRFIFEALYRRQSGGNAGEISISINGSNINGRGLGYTVNDVTNGHTPVFVELIISLSANDYVMPFIYSVGAGSDWYVGENLAYFGGYLIG